MTPLHNEGPPDLHLSWAEYSSVQVTEGRPTRSLNILYDGLFRDPNLDDGHEQYNRLRWLRGFVGSHTIVNSIWDAFAYITQLEDLQTANNGERSFERRRIADLEAQMLAGDVSQLRLEEAQTLEEQLNKALDESIMALRKSQAEKSRLQDQLDRLVSESREHAKAYLSDVSRMKSYVNGDAQKAVIDKLKGEYAALKGKNTALHQQVEAAKQVYEPQIQELKSQLGHATTRFQVVCRNHDIIQKELDKKDLKAALSREDTKQTVASLEQRIGELIEQNKALLEKQRTRTYCDGTGAPRQLRSRQPADPNGDTLSKAYRMGGNGGFAPPESRKRSRPAAAAEDEVEVEAKVEANVEDNVKDNVEDID